MGIKSRVNTWKLFATTIFLISVSSYNVFASWTGPQEIVKGPWGAGSNQFGITYQDTFDFIPIFAITTDLKIVIRDGTNSRVKVYDTSGALDIIVPYRTNLSYKELTTADSYGFTGDFIGYGEGGINYFRRPDQKVYIHFSPTGELLKTTTERPLELGRVKERPLGGGRYKVTVEYSDRTWGIVGKGRFPRYIRDSKGNLYASGDMQAARYNKCGRQLALLTMPEAIVEVIPSGVPGIEPIDNVQEEYGAPVLAPNGDVYTWKRTPDTYSILKWTWQDDPNPPADIPDAPVNLAISSSTTALNLTWTAPLQDPGCVTEYEIARSTVAGGSYSAIGTVANGVFSYSDTSAGAGTTYYYRVRAVGGDGYSEYSNAVSGQR